MRETLKVTAREWGDRTLVETESETFGFNKMVVAMPFTEFKARMDKRLEAGIPIEEIFPELSADERELLISGCTPLQWEIALMTGEWSEECD